MKKITVAMATGVGCLLAFGTAPGCGSGVASFAEGGGGGSGVTGGRGSSTGGNGSISSGGSSSVGSSGGVGPSGVLGGSASSTGRNDDSGGSGSVAASGAAGASGVTGGSASSAGGNGNSSVGGNAGGWGNINALLGARCANDAACGAKLRCLTSDSGAIDGGGPAGGICTADCMADPTVCKTLSANGLCVGSGISAFCYEACLGGTPPITEAKCHNRAEMACNSLGAQGLAACLPQCHGAQGECRPGTSCDFSSAIATAGLCRATAPAGLTTGAKCDPAPNAVDPCRGLCVPFSQTIGACGDGCTVGAPDGCNPTGSAKLEGFCLPVSSTDGAGGAGLCTKLCDCTADCGHPDMKCLGNANLEAALGRKGICDIQRASDTPAATGSIIDTCGPG